MRKDDCYTFKLSTQTIQYKWVWNYMDIFYWDVKTRWHLVFLRRPFSPLDPSLFLKSCFFPMFSSICLFCALRYFFHLIFYVLARLSSLSLNLLIFKIISAIQGKKLCVHTDTAYKYPEMFLFSLCSFKQSLLLQKLYFLRSLFWVLCFVSSLPASPLRSGSIPGC